MRSASNGSNDTQAARSKRSNRTRRSDPELKRIAHSDLNVLMTGRPGVNLDRLALSIHRASPRHGSAFVTCRSPFQELQALARFLDGVQPPPSPESEGESSLSRGTLYIDRVGELSADEQRTLLRILDSRETAAPGAGVDFRVLASTGPGLGDLVAAGDFRSDLYFRLNEIRIAAPAALSKSTGDARRRAEKRAIEKALAETRGDRGRTAQLLSMSLRRLNQKIREFQLDARARHD